MDLVDAASKWVDAWSEGWRNHDPDTIANRYAADAVFSSHPFREPRSGKQGAKDYAREVFAQETSADFTFGEPIVAGERAAVEYQATIGATDGKHYRLAGVTLLTFGDDGLATEHRDYWAIQEVPHTP